MPNLGIERVIVQDWDQGLDILSFLVDHKVSDRVYFETLKDTLKPTQDGPKVKEATAYRRGMALMNNWITGDEKLGPAVEWGRDTLFVVDSITGMGDAAMHFCTNVLNITDEWKATGEAMGHQAMYAKMLIALKCHLIVFSHIRFMGGGGRIEITSKDGNLKSTKEVDSTVDGKQYPSVLGRLLPPQFGRHFNVQIKYHMIGSQRKIRTVPLDDKMALKVPFKVRDELPQETGLKEIFEAFITTPGLEKATVVGPAGYIHEVKTT